MQKAQSSVSNLTQVYEIYREWTGEREREKEKSRQERMDWYLTLWFAPAEITAVMLLNRLFSLLCRPASDEPRDREEDVSRANWAERWPCSLHSRTRQHKVISLWNLSRVCWRRKLRNQLGFNYTRKPINHATAERQHHSSTAMFLISRWP